MIFDRFYPLKDVFNPFIGNLSPEKDSFALFTKFSSGKMDKGVLIENFDKLKE